MKVRVWVTFYPTDFVFDCPFYFPYSDVDKTCGREIKDICPHFPREILKKIKPLLEFFNAYAPICRQECED